MKRTAGIIFRTIILILIGIAIGIWITDYNFSGSKIGFRNTGNDKILKTLYLVKNNYVDSINTDSIEGVTVNDLLQNLDPHSIYLPARQAQSLNEKLDGGFTGIGLEYQLLRDTLVITQIYNDGPAAHAKLPTGSKVLTVNGKPFSGTHLTVNRISRTFRGAKDTKITLGVLMDNGQTASYTIKRGFVDLSSLDAAYLTDNFTGYIKITKFATTTDDDFRSALQKLKAQGMKKLVLDLRGNGGGYVNTATAMADEFLPGGKLIVYTKGAHEPRTDYFSTDSGNYLTGKLAVMIDERSASASEILAGALQDLDRATIIGRRSFGKGLVQQQYPFGDGTAINLTIARYYTPSGRSIQKSYKDGLESYQNELVNRERKGELLSASSNLSDSAFAGTTTYHTVNGRPVFSKGGIMPDVFIPVDTTQFSILLDELNENQLFSAFVIDKLHPVLKKYATADDFIAHFEITDDIFKNFISYASQTIKVMDPLELKASREMIKTVLKANTARFKWGNNAYYRIINSNDKTFKAAINL
ncbi:S41 family peptidase [Mucilaginibacter segetis]|uniref:S41 family peptidase n=1 Tax=Mucilaginibacter segetis TaxID=2793071 RepID=A0A934PY99_9SPHI|nr:S41 family peptidase [Mucilaginibacter segetis]MBK0381238.1 S41 family peptidase [Mucilaginibacter segetis]